MWFIVGLGLLYFGGKRIWREVFWEGRTPWGIPLGAIACLVGLYLVFEVR